MLVNTNKDLVVKFDTLAEGLYTGRTITGSRRKTVQAKICFVFFMTLKC